VEDYEVGILYNPNSVSLKTDKLYKAGTHTVSPGARFFTFPRNIRTVVMGSTDSKGSKRVDALDARTKDALKVTIDCSF